MEQVGEVIQAATTGFVAQSYLLNEAPPFGSLVRVPQGEAEVTTLYGVVASIETTSIDPARRPVARGQGASSLTEIYHQHPQLLELFCTQFTVKLLGHAHAGQLRHYLPPLPPEIHQLVYLCSPEEVVAFTQVLTFLSLLLAGQSPFNSDEVTSAFLRYAGEARSGTERQEFLVRAGKHLVPLLRGESVRLTGLLGRLR